MSIWRAPSPTGWVTVIQCPSAGFSERGTSSIAMTAKVVEAAAGSHRRTKRRGA